jgi:hypothetical protein
VTVDQENHFLQQVQSNLLVRCQVPTKKQYEDDVHNINLLFLPNDGLHYMINFIYLQVYVSIK